MQRHGDAFVSIYFKFKSQSRRQYESDDNASETSSMCSERSGQSMPVYRRSHLRPVNVGCTY